MSDSSIQRLTPTGSALSAEHYQTYEMALEHDGVLGGDNIAQIRSYAAYARAQAQAIHKTIAATSGIEDVAAIKAEMLETEQTFARVGIYADQRIGELLRKLPKAKGNQYQNSANSPAREEAPTKAEALQDAGISRSEAYRLEDLAANPDVVQAVLDKATAEGRVASRAEVLRAIQERDLALQDLESAQKEITALEQQGDKAYEDGFKAGEQQAKYESTTPRTVVEREVVEVEPDDYRETKRRVRELEHLERVHSDDAQKLRRQLDETRRELEQARGILGMSQQVHDVRRDVQYLISATNQYVRQYGGLTWTAASLASVDEPTLEELRKAVTNLATFSSALVACLEEFNG